MTGDFGVLTGGEHRCTRRSHDLAEDAAAQNDQLRMP